MKQKSFFIVMGLVFAALMALVLFVKEWPTVFSSVMAFPFEQLGALLRLLSRTGNLGNGLALALCVAFALLPILLALKQGRDRAFLGENILLCGIGVIVFLALFAMANPSDFFSAVPYKTDEFLPVIKGIIGGVVWSFLVLWLVLRLVRLLRTGDTVKLLVYLRRALYALCLLFEAVLVLSCVSMLLNDLSSIQQSMDGVMAVLHFIACALPYVLDIVITFYARMLLDAYMAKNAEDTARHAALLSSVCCLALVLTASTTAVLNGIQLLLSRFLSNISVNVDIPIVSLAFILLLLLLSRFIVENRKLQSDNDLFI